MIEPAKEAAKALENLFSKPCTTERCTGRIVRGYWLQYCKRCGLVTPND